jgi:hypothetical protein
LRALAHRAGMLRRTRIASCSYMKRTCTFGPVAMHALQRV